MASEPDTFEMQTSAQWKAFSHPLRLRILEELAREPRTNEELAAALGEQSGKLYFHTKKLLDAGLIVLDSTRQKGPITEKLYRAVARRFTAPSPVKGGKRPPLELYLAAGLDLYRSAWAETSGDLTELGFHLVLPLEPERRAEFAARVRALFEDFRSSGSEAQDAQKTALTVVLHTLDRSKEDAKEKKDALAMDAANGSAANGIGGGIGENDARGQRG